MWFDISYECKTVINESIIWVSSLQFRMHLHCTPVLGTTNGLRSIKKRTIPQKMGCFCYPDKACKNRSEGLRISNIINIFNLTFMEQKDHTQSTQKHSVQKNQARPFLKGQNTQLAYWLLQLLQARSYKQVNLINNCFCLNNSLTNLFASLVWIN